MMLEALFKEALQIYVKKEPLPSLEARYYPYAGLSSTIRLRGGHIYARVSDILKDAPEEILFALACILIAKLYHRKAPKAQQELYRSYLMQQHVTEASNT